MELPGRATWSEVREVSEVEDKLNKKAVSNYSNINLYLYWRSYYDLYTHL